MTGYRISITVLCIFLWKSKHFQKQSHDMCLSQTKPVKADFWFHHGFDYVPLSLWWHQGAYHSMVLDTLHDICTFAKWPMGLVYNVIWYLSQLRINHAGQPSALTNEDPSFLKEIIETSPSLYPDEMQQKLSDVWEIKIAVATILCALQNNIHLSQKMSQKWYKTWSAGWWMVGKFWRVQKMQGAGEWQANFITATIVWLRHISHDCF